MPSNPRNSEGAFIKLADGTLYFAYSRYTNGSGLDDDAADIAAVLSHDDGRSWSDPVTVFKNPQMNLMSVSLLRLNNGLIAMVYLKKSAVQGWKGFVDCRPKIVFSSDEAATWSAPVEIANIPAAYLVVNNDRLIQLKNGRLLLPASHHQYNSNGKLGAGIIRFFFSDDNGLSWKTNKEYIFPLPQMHNGFMEPGVIELKDGSVMCFIRTSAGCHYKAFSYDGGENWTQAIPAGEFSSPESPMSIKRDPASGILYAVWNSRNSLYAVRAADSKWHRTPLVMATSADEGRTWENHRVLEDAPDHGYCYTAMYFDGNKLHLGYCCGGAPDCRGPLADTKLCTLNIGEAEQDV